MSARDRLERVCGPQVPPELIAALDAYRAEVLAEDGQAYVGELAMLRGLVATLRAVATQGGLDEVRKLLDEHQRDEQDAYAEAGEGQ